LGCVVVVLGVVVLEVVVVVIKVHFRHGIEWQQAYFRPLATWMIAAGVSVVLE
jgi:TRAP-type C4-dicarboxylate transport system permease small subunit